MNKLIYPLLILILGGCNHNNHIVLDLGRKVPKNILDSAYRTNILTSKSQITSALEYTSNKITYEFVIDSSNMITFLSTWDKNFLSEEGYKIGSRYENFSKPDKINGRMVSGWGYEVKLRNKWHAVFCDSLVLNDSRIENTSQVGFFYKDHY